MKKIITITIHMSDMTKAEKKLIDDFVTMEGLTHDRDNGRRHLFDAVYRGDATITITEQRGWKAGWNVPGYLPESEPLEFGTWTEARDHLVTALIENDTSASGFGNADNASARRGFMAAEVDKPIWLGYGKYVWWIAQEQ